MPLTRRLVRRALARLECESEVSSLDALLVGELDCGSDESDEDGGTEEPEFCSTWWISSVKESSSCPEDASVKSIPRPIGAMLMSLEREVGLDEIALATLDAAIEVAGVMLVVLPLAEAVGAATATVDEEERTVILGVDVTAVLSVARRKLGMDRTGCGLTTLFFAPVLQADPFNRDVASSRIDTEPDVYEPAVPGLCERAA